MKKFIITCPKCHKKMKISDKIAKYRCPNCKEIYKYNIFRKVYHNIKYVIDGFISTIRDIIFNIKRKYNNAKTTYQYMSQLKKNIKNDPNWSQYRNQQREEKDVTPNKSFKDSFKNMFNKK
ncbi:hypothetical protein [Fusobacterium sp.]|uniref:hypothetical protein n=1 Tax=Fusobacterium sp. TaxID=68766 RepID=UPI000C707080|nr:hypothetical protein [Fusobacterium sp.]